jgi:Tol biopolymer transport system component
MTRFLVPFIGKLLLGCVCFSLLAIGVGHTVILADNDLVFSQYSYTSYKYNIYNMYRMDIVHQLIYPLTSDDDTGVQLNWSRDGQQIAFVRDGDPLSAIYIMDLQGGKLRRLTAPGMSEDHPAWSPDGRSIVYIHTMQSILPELYMKDLETGVSSRLTDNDTNEYAPNWSPDGRSIAFASDRTVAGNLDIFSLDITTKEIRPLIATQDTETNPVWSPDGRYLVYSTTGTNISMVIYDTLTAHSTRLYSENFSNIGTPDWSPDVRFIVYSAFVSFDSSGIFRLDVAACLQQPITCNPQLLTPAPNYYLSPRWRPTQP